MRIGSRVRLSESQVSDLELAVGEACTNAVKFGDLDSATVFVQFMLQPGSIEIEVRNTGPAFECTALEPLKPQASNLREGGLGLYLMGQMVDELRVSCESGETAVTMIKSLNSE
jgi:serine/threonine-protein kinase RsbW